MARKNRYWFPGAIYHITSRGNRKDLIFMDDQDRNQYLKYLKVSIETYPSRIYSYCLMPNHIHLLIETINHPPKLIMQKLHHRYAVYFNKRHDFVGHLFQDRYGAQPIDSIKYLLIASRYIHVNPFKAQLVADPLQYLWSSYPTYINEESSTLVTTDKILSFFPEPKIENYRRFVEKSARHAST